MKIFLILSLMMMSLSSFAFAEIRCDGSNIDLDLDFWGSNTSNVRADLRIRENGTTRVDSFTMFQRSTRLYQIEFYGAGNRLEIDTWPDRGMRPLRSYNATFRERNFGYVNLRCTYWN